MNQAKLPGRKSVGRCEGLVELGNVSKWNCITIFTRWTDQYQTE